MPPVLSMCLTLYPAVLYFSVSSGVLSATKVVLPLSGTNTLRRWPGSERSKAWGTSKSLGFGSTVAPRAPAPAFANKTLVS